MQVARLLPIAHEHMSVIRDDCAVIEAARRLSAPHTYLLIVCDHRGIAIGVVRKLDVVSHISQCSGHACTIPVSAVMTKDVVACRPDDWLRDVWSVMKTRYLLCIPVLDADRRPLGILYARDLLQTLLKEVEDEETLLLDYVMSVGFH